MFKLYKCDVKEAGGMRFFFTRSSTNFAFFKMRHYFSTRLMSYTQYHTFRYNSVAQPTTPGREGIVLVKHPSKTCDDVRTTKINKK